MASLIDLLGLANVAAVPQTPQPAPQPGQDLTPEQLNALPQIVVQQRSAPAAPAAHAPSKFRNFLGAIGDALLVANGGQPLYQQRRQRQQIGSALSTYLGDPMLSQVFQADPDTGVALYKMRHPAEPDFLRDMRAVGIDPATDEGKSLVAAHFGKQPSAAIQDYQYARANGYQGDFASFVRDYLRPQLQSPIMIPAGAQPVPQPSAQPALRLNPQTGQWEPE